MKHWKKILIAIILLSALAGIAYAYYVWNKPARNVANEEAIKITATALYDSFAHNEQAANASFLNKAVEVTGIVNSIKKNQAGETVVYLQSSDIVFGVNCTFKQPPKAINKGSAITFKGICTGYLSDVILNEGILIK